MPLYPSEGLKHFWRSQIDEGLSLEELPAEICARLVGLPADQVDAGIEETLRLICSIAEIDESTIYLREIDNPDTFVLSYVLRDPSLPPPPKIKFTATDNFPWCNQKLIANETIYLPDTQAAPPEADIDKASWRKYNVVSALVIPLSTGGGRPLGFWGIDSTTTRREWSAQWQRRLKVISAVFAATIERAISDRQLLASEMRLTLAAETAGAGFWTYDVETGAIWGTTQVSELFGFQPGEPLNITGFFDAIHPEDRDSVRRAIDAMNAGQERKFEYRVLPSPETVRWVLSSGRRQVFAADGRSLLVGITFDITERRNNEEALRTLSGRLIEAQEQERKRIARELHDSIGQQLALLAVDLKGLQSPPGADSDEFTGRVSHLSRAVKSLASEVQALSHRLHSASLDYLGLGAALRGLCREIGDHHTATVLFTETSMPGSVPPDVALALFRITQESLHNALKYSGVREFQVLLEGTGTHISLSISDKGTGFNVTEARQGRGIGLISMQERILAIGGTFSIESHPGKGTRISARVPL